MHPVHLSVLFWMTAAGTYPFWLQCSAWVMIFLGQKNMHRPQPLHLSASMVTYTVPCLLDIRYSLFHPMPSNPDSFNWPWHLHMFQIESRLTLLPSKEPRALTGPCLARYYRNDIILDAFMLFWRYNTPYATELYHQPSALSRGILVQVVLISWGKISLLSLTVLPRMLPDHRSIQCPLAISFQ